MYNASNLFFLVCESSLHAGSGSDLDFIDNPIQRERHTGYPKIEASSLKGALRERFATVFNEKDPQLINAFGPDDPDPDKAAKGKLLISDARLLLFPVKSMKGVFAWVTCPLVLERLQSDMRKIAGFEDADLGLQSLTDALTPNSEEDLTKALVFSDELTINKKNLVLEEYAFQAIKIEYDINAWLANHIFPDQAYWKNALEEQLVIISNNDFVDFVELTTEVITRNKIDPATGAVAEGALFTEEYLPADSVLYAYVMAEPDYLKPNSKTAAASNESAANTLRYFQEGLTTSMKNTLQVGGNASIGKGLIRTQFLDQGK